jgi:hypothetical protein
VSIWTRCITALLLLKDAVWKRAEKSKEYQRFFAFCIEVPCENRKAACEIIKISKMFFELTENASYDIIFSGYFMKMYRL